MEKYDELCSDEMQQAVKGFVNADSSFWGRMKWLFLGGKRTVKKDDDGASDA